MLRRKFIRIIGGTAIAWPLIAMAQQPSKKVWRIAHVYPGRYDNPADMALYDVFRSELGKLGYIEGRNLVIDQRSADGKIERLPSLVSELIALRPDIIAAIATPAIAAAQRATSTIPIIMAPATDPVGSGFVKSFARPGETSRAWPTWLATRSAKALNFCTRSCRRQNVLLCLCLTIQLILNELAETAAKTLGLAAIGVMATTPNDLEPAFETMKQESCEAVFVLADATRSTIPTLAARSRMPAFYQSSPYMPLGGLASYHPKIEAIYRKVAQYVDRIFHGADPAEYPVEQPVVFELAVNLKTAAALGVTIPDSVLARADRVIE